MPSSVSPLSEDSTTRALYTKMSQKKPQENFEDEQIKVFAKIVTTLSQDINNPLEPHKIFEFHNSMTQMLQSKKQTLALEELVKNIQFSQFLQAGHLAGEEVEVKGNQFAIGTVPLAYDVPENALKTFIDIFDEKGARVKTSLAETKPGSSVLFFNHTGDDGKKLPPGQYTYHLRSFVASDTPLSPPEEWLSDSFPVPAKGAPPKLSYDIPKGVAKANIEITDASGHVIHTLVGETSEGKHEFTVDGLKNGAAFPPGVYQFTLRALDDKNEAVDIETRVRALVESVEMKGGTPMFRHNGPVYTPLENYTALNKILKNPHEKKGD